MIGPMATDQHDWETPSACRDSVYRVLHQTRKEQIQRIKGIFIIHIHAYFSIFVPFCFFDILIFDSKEFLQIWSYVLHKNNLLAFYEQLFNIMNHL